MKTYLRWIRTTFVDKYFLEEDYAGNPLMWPDRRFLSDRATYRLGPARLRQYRGADGELGLGPMMYSWERY